MAIKSAYVKGYQEVSSAGLSSGRKMPVVYCIGKSNAFGKYIGDKCSINICSNRTELTLLFL